MKDFISLKDVSGEEITKLIDLALAFKKGYTSDNLLDQNWGLLFNKSSTRTRVSFEVGIRQLGGTSIYLDSASLQIGRGESVYDTAKVLERYLDGIIIRTYDHADVEVFAQAGKIPVINGLTDLEHPCQILADLVTIYEIFEKLEGIKVSYFGDGKNNICRSWIQAASRMNMFLTIAAPEEFYPDADLIQNEKEESKYGGEYIKLTDDINEAIKDCDVLYTDVWVSMGKESEAQSRIDKLKPFQINSSLMNKGKKKMIFMHCLPAHRGHEVTDEVLSDEKSVIYDQAENRLYAQKAILQLLGREK